MKFIASFAVFIALTVPVANASAATVTRAEAQAILAALTAEVQVLQLQLTTLNNTGEGMVAGVSTSNGFVAYVNGAATMRLNHANRDVAIDTCYVFARPSLISGDEYTCEFNGEPIFDSVVDAAF